MNDAGKTYNVAVIGGGAAGLMCAATILESSPDASVVVIERNAELGKKVKISGGGRCNVTTGIEDIKTVLSKYPRGGKFLMSAMHAFPPSSMIAWVESHGVPLKTEEDGRVFPVSDKGDDVVGVFERVIRKSDIRLNASVSGIRKMDNGFNISLKNGDEIQATHLVIATGGQAYRQTGSTGDGYAFAMSLGHSITQLAPSLSSFLCTETWPADVSGLSFPAVSISSGASRVEGSMMFTHKGITGPAVFAFSSLTAFEECDTKHPLRISIDLFPDESKEDLCIRIRQLIEANPKKECLTVCSMVIPKSLSSIALSSLKMDGSRHASELSKKETEALAGWIKSIPLSAVGKGAGDEFVTAGGVSTKEVNPKTMESTLIPNLFFAGEVLDIDGYTGGFNLQACWATGRAAGMEIAGRIHS